VLLCVPVPARAQAPPVQFLTGSPALAEVGGTLMVEIPITNNGSSEATSVQVTGMTLRTSTLITATSLPVLLGDIAPGRGAIINANFNKVELIPDTPYLLAINGTYQVGGVSNGFAVNRFIRLPKASAGVNLRSMVLLLPQIFILPAPQSPPPIPDISPNDPIYPFAQALSPFMRVQLLCPGCRLSVNFEPNRGFSRAELAVLLVSLLVAGNQVRLLNFAETNAVLSTVSDTGDSITLPILARPFVATAIQSGIMTVQGGEFQPTSPASQADVTAALNSIQAQFGLPIVISRL